MVRICIVPSNPRNSPWGIARQAALLADGLERLGYEVVFLAPPEDSKHKKYTYAFFERIPRADVYLFASHIISHFLPCFPRERALIWVADFIPLRWGTLIQKIFLRFEMFFMRFAKLFGNSRYTSSLIKKHFGMVLGYVYPPLSPVFYPRSKKEIEAVREKYGLPEEYILHVGNTKPHKNVCALMGATSLADTPLVKVGGDEFYVETFARRHDAKVVYIPYVSDDELAAIYSGASVYVQPSLEEGFGYPVVEAAACGTPVVVSDRGSLPELAEIVNGVVVSPAPRALAHGIEEALSRSVNSAHVQKYFSPESSAKRFISILDNALIGF